MGIKLRDVAKNVYSHSVFGEAEDMWKNRKKIGQGLKEGWEATKGGDIARTAQDVAGSLKRKNYVKRLKERKSSGASGSW
jgi:hypothetical protein